MAEQRTALLQIRMTPTEHARVVAEAKAAGVKASNLARQRILGHAPPPSGREAAIEAPAAELALATEGRRCSLCRAPVASPTLRRHACGGEIFPKPPKGA